MWTLHSNCCIYRDLPTRSVNYGESCSSPHLVILLSLSPKSTEKKKDFQNWRWGRLRHIHIGKAIKHYISVQVYITSQDTEQKVPIENILRLTSGFLKHHKVCFIHGCTALELKKKKNECCEIKSGHFENCNHLIHRLYVSHFWVCETSECFPENT